MRTLTHHAIQEIVAERERVITEEGRDAANDDRYTGGELACAAAAYALGHFRNPRILEMVRNLWPWAQEWWKPTTRRRNLIKAGALIVAELERLERKGIVS